MPIHLDILNPRQAEAGKIKIGGLGKERRKKHGDGTWRAPRKLDYFLVTKTVRDEKTGEFEVDHELMEKLPKDKDGKCREIPIFLDSDIIEEIFPHSLNCYVGRTMHCKGDGKTARRHEMQRQDGRLVKTGNVVERPCPCDYLNAKSGYTCKPHGSLWVTIAAGDETRIGARHCFRTTSWNSVRWIVSGLDAIQRQVGTLVGMPCCMVVRPHQVNTDNGPKIVYVVHVELRTKDLFGLQDRAVKAAMARQRVTSIAAQQRELGLPAPGEHESARDQAEIQQEFHPNMRDGLVVEDDDQGDEEDYNPVTGEVYDTTASEKAPEDESQETDERPEDQSQGPENPDAELPDGHPARVRIAELLTKLARARDFSDKDMKQARIEIWAEACEAATVPKLPWRSMSLNHARAIDDVLRGLLRKRDEAEGDPSEEPPPEDQEDFGFNG